MRQRSHSPATAAQSPRAPRPHYSTAGAALFELVESLDGEPGWLPLGVSRSRLDLLRRLATGGASTVSRLARGRAASRQGVQRLADALAAEGWVAFEPNPRHRRSPLVALTSRGESAYRELARREAEALNQLAAGVDAEALRRAAALLREIRSRARR